MRSPAAMLHARLTALGPEVENAGLAGSNDAGSELDTRGDNEPYDNALNFAMRRGDHNTASHNLRGSHKRCAHAI